jgi:sulfonate transport system permease protein
MKKAKRFLKNILIFALILLLWELASGAGIWSAYVLPPPQKVCTALVKLLRNGELAKHLLISLRRVAQGFSISCILTFVLTLLAALLPAVEPYYSSLLGVMRHIPPICLIPLFILWFGIGELPKLIVIVLSSIFPVLLNTESGIFGCDKGLIEVGRALGFSNSRIFFKIMLPNAVPEILVGIRIGLGYAWRAIVGAEMVAAASGLGYLILDAQTLSRTDIVIGGILGGGAIGFVTDRVCALAEELSVRHRGGRTEHGQV